MTLSSSLLSLNPYSQADKHIQVEIAMACFEPNTKDKLQYFLAVSISMLLLLLLLPCMAVSISIYIYIKRFGIPIFFAAVRIGNFGKSNNTATWKPATYWTLPLLILVFSDHSLAK